MRAGKLLRKPKKLSSSLLNMKWSRVNKKEFEKNFQVGVLLLFCCYSCTWRKTFTTVFIVEPLCVFFVVAENEISSSFTFSLFFSCGSRIVRKWMQLQFVLLLFKCLLEKENLNLWKIFWKQRKVSWSVCGENIFISSVERLGNFCVKLRNHKHWKFATVDGMTETDGSEKPWQTLNENF